MKATVENRRASVEKLSPKESFGCGDTALRGSVRAPKGFSEGKGQCRHPRHSPEGTVIPLRPKDFQQLLRLPNS